MSDVESLVDNLLTLQGALAAISDLEKGNQDYVSRVQCLQYDLDFKNTQSLDSARSLLNRAFAKITNPVEVKANLIFVLTSLCCRWCSRTECVRTVARRGTRDSCPTCVTTSRLSWTGSCSPEFCPRRCSAVTASGTGPGRCSAGGATPAAPPVSGSGTSETSGPGRLSPRTRPGTT